MLTVKHYFLKDIERFNIEEFIFSQKSGISRDEVYTLDDEELMELYKACNMEVLTSIGQ